MRISVRAVSLPAAGRCAAPVTEKGEPSAAESAAIARAVVEAGEDERRLGLRRRQDLEGHLGEHAERAVRAGEELHQVVAGDVLHHPAAGLDDLAAAGDGADADQAVAGGAGLDAARTGEIGRGDRADRRLARAMP